MKNKNNVYVQVDSQEQAETYRKVLEAMGEPISVDYMPWFSEYNLQTAISGNWILAASATGTKITFGELIDLLTKPQKIAVRVDNEKEFNALMKYYDSLGWKWNGGMNPLYYEKDGGLNLENLPLCVQYNDFFKWNLREETYQIIPFSDFAKEHNIKLPLIISEDKVWLYEGDEFCFVNKHTNEIDLFCAEKMYRLDDGSTEENTKDKNNLIFSTKQAALDWIEAQKHTFPIINETKKEIVTEYEIEFNEKSSVLITKDNVKFNGSEFDLTQLEVLAIVSKFKSLQ